MSTKGILLLISSYLLLLSILFYHGYKAVQELEASAVLTMETWCGPETTKRFKEIRGLSCE